MKQNSTTAAKKSEIQKNSPYGIDAATDTKYYFLTSFLRFSKRETIYDDLFLSKSIPITNCFTWTIISPKDMERIIKKQYKCFSVITHDIMYTTLKTTLHAI